MEKGFPYYAQPWTGSRWLSFDGGWPMFAPDSPACYAIYLDGVLSYIGQTASLRKRLAGHKIDLCRYSEHINSTWGQFDKITIKAHFGVKFGDWAMRELRLIRRLQPPLNCVGSIKRRATG